MPSARCLTLARTVHGKIVTVARGGTPFLDMARRAQAAGAVGVLIINTDDELFSPGSGEDGQDVTIPVILVKAKDGRSFPDGNHASFPSKQPQASEQEGGGSASLSQFPLVILSQPLFPGETAVLSGADLKAVEARIKDLAGRDGRFLVGYAPQGKVATHSCIAEVQHTACPRGGPNPYISIVGISRAKVWHVPCPLS